MVVSYNWLQEYFDDKLPAPKELGELLNTRAFELEGIEEVDGDFAIDMDVLPNRSHDCFSHYGIAKEISVHTHLKLKEINPKVEQGDESNIEVNIEDEICRRYIALEINDVEVKESPKELQKKLKTIGEKSINNIVDITNIVMFELGQPLHAFDGDKLDGNIVVRKAKNNETITTLDDKEVKLDDSILVIADEKDVLAIAGVKGGKKAGVDGNTKNIVLESANFLPSSIRKTRNKIGIQTESSKRFENEITPLLTEKGILQAAELIQEHCGGEVKKLVDIFPRPPKHSYMTGVSLGQINSLLGTKLSNKDVEVVLDKLGFEYKLVNTKECVLEEVRKHLGKKYNTFPSVIYDAPDEFDCSSLMTYSYAACGLSIPRVTVDQYVWGNDIKEGELEPGDLVFSNRKEGKIFYETIDFLSGTKVEEGVDHVGMYMGDGMVLHSSLSNEVSIEESLKESKQFKHIMGYRRVVDMEEERYAITIPDERLDLRIEADLIEEIGRVYGYENIEEVPIKEMDFTPRINKEYYYNNLIRKTLADLGWSEIYTYSFVEEGEVSPLKPIAEDKGFLRTTLVTGMKKALDVNLYNADLLTLDTVKTFEIGNGYFKDGEKLKLCLGVVNNKVKKPGVDETIEEALKKLSDETGVTFEGEIKEGIIEISLDDIYEKASEPKEYVSFENIGKVIYKIPLQFPFVLRDISVWVEGENKESEVEELIKENAGELFVNQKLVDVYPKDGKTSYSYRLVFQSQEKTLTDVEVNEVMDDISKAMEGKGWEVR